MIDTQDEGTRRGRPRVDRARTRTVAVKTDEDTADALHQYAADLGLRGASTLIHALLTAELERSGRLPTSTSAAAEVDEHHRLPAA